mmetsp:Transcript_34855/g.76270  ORF Transcript_34855/g.76270 Transcript_34855/m.76270 type:complete len:84 (+) Transcript_34855:7-258(+)
MSQHEAMRRHDAMMSIMATRTSRGRTLRGSGLWWKLWTAAYASHDAFKGTMAGCNLMASSSKHRGCPSASNFYSAQLFTMNWW